MAHPQKVALLLFIKINNFGDEENGLPGVAFPLFKEMLSELINNFGDEEKPQAFPLNCWDPSHEERETSKNWSMLLVAAGTRYSLVKGERIVRSVPTAQLRAVLREAGFV